MDKVFEMQRELDRLRDRVWQLERGQGRQLVRVPVGGGGSSSTGETDAIRNRVWTKATYAALIAIPVAKIKEGDQGYVRDIDQWYGVVMAAPTVWDYDEADLAALEALVGVTEGQTGHAQDTGTSYIYQSSAWVEIGFHWRALYVFSAADKTALDALTRSSAGVVDGDKGYDEATDTVYDRVDGAWAKAGALTIYSAANYTALTALIASDSLTEPAFGKTTDNDQRYYLEDGTWRVRDGVFRMAAQPSSIGEREGDRWAETDAHVLWWYNGTAWKKLSHFTV